MTDYSRQTAVQRLIEEGWNALSAEAVRDLIHDDYDSNDGGFFELGSDTPGGLRRLTGAEAFAAHIAKYRELYDNLTFEIQRMMTDDDTVVTVWHADGTSKTKTTPTRTGAEVPLELRGEQGVSLTEVVGGKISRHDLFWPGAE